MLKYLTKLTLNLFPEVVMRALILIVSIIISGSSFAQDLNKFGFAYMSKSECENHEKAIIKLNELITHIETNAPNKSYVRCGRLADGKQGCITLDESYEAYEENLSWGEEDEKWNQLIRQVWKDCGIDDFGFDSEALTFE